MFHTTITSKFSFIVTLKPDAWKFADNFDVLIEDFTMEGLVWFSKSSNLRVNSLHTRVNKTYLNCFR